MPSIETRFSKQDLTVRSNSPERSRPSFYRDCTFCTESTYWNRALLGLSPKRFAVAPSAPKSSLHAYAGGAVHQVDAHHPIANIFRRKPIFFPLPILSKWSGLWGLVLRRRCCRPQLPAADRSIIGSPVGPAASGSWCLLCGLAERFFPCVTIRAYLRRTYNYR